MIFTKRTQEFKVRYTIKEKKKKNCILYNTIKLIKIIQEFKSNYTLKMFYKDHSRIQNYFNPLMLLEWSIHVLVIVRSRHFHVNTKQARTSTRPDRNK